MKAITLLLLISNISIAEAKIYKCFDEEKSRYAYQQKPCANTDDPEANKLEVREVSEARIAAEKERFARRLDAHKAKSDPNTPPPQPPQSQPTDGERPRLPNKPSVSDVKRR